MPSPSVYQLKDEDNSLGGEHDEESGGNNIEYSAGRVSSLRADQNQIFGRKIRLLDMLFDEMLTLNRTVSQLKDKEAYFLVTTCGRSELVTVSHKEILERTDVTSEAAGGQKSFVHGDYTYKRYRKVL